MYDYKEQINTFKRCGDEMRPLHEQTLLHHMENLLQFAQYDGVTDEEIHNAYNVALSIMTMFVQNDRPIPNHYLEHLIELCQEFVGGDTQ